MQWGLMGFDQITQKLIFLLLINLLLIFCIDIIIHYYINVAA